MGPQGHSEFGRVEKQECRIRIPESGTATGVNGETLKAVSRRNLSR